MLAIILFGGGYYIYLDQSYENISKYPVDEPIRNAIKKNDYSRLKKLLEQGVKPNDFRYGETVLHLAARTGNVKIVQLLLDYGFKINETDNSGIHASFRCS